MALLPLGDSVRAGRSSSWTERCCLGRRGTEDAGLTLLLAAAIELGAAVLPVREALSLVALSAP